MKQIEATRISANGATSKITVAIGSLCQAIGADCLDTVRLSNGRVMIVDDAGHSRGLPVNVEATKLYHARCIPGTTHQILGDVLIVNDADFE
jgi:hypothetical protein